MTSLALAAATTNPLSFDVWTFAFQAINVLIVMYVLYRVLWGPLGKIIEEREHQIESSIERAHAAKEEAEALLARYQQQLREAEREAQSIVEKATRAGEEARQRILAEAEREAEKMMERARIEIAREREKALEQIREEVAGLVMLATQKVVGAALTDEHHKALVRDFVQQVDPQLLREKQAPGNGASARRVGDA